jgi:hypothetical protein
MLGSFFPLPAFQLDKIYLRNRMFNNYNLTPEFKMDYNQKRYLRKSNFKNKALLIMNHTIAKGTIDMKMQLTVISIRLKMSIPFFSLLQSIDRYDRVIGKGNANSINIIN